MKNKFVFVVIFLITVSILNADSSKRDIIGAVLEYDALYGSTSCYSELEIVVERLEKKETMTFQFWARGEKKAFVRVKSSEKYEGVGILVVDRNIWLYYPKEKRVKKIKRGELTQTFLGTDFRYVDILREFSTIEYFKFESYSPEKPEPCLEYVKCIPRTPTPDGIGYMLFCYDRNRAVPCWFHVYDSKNRLVRKAVYSGVKSIKGRNIPMVMKLTPVGKKGHSTTITYKKLDFKAEIPDKIFSMKNLRK